MQIYIIVTTNKKIIFNSFIGVPYVYALQEVK